MVKLIGGKSGFKTARDLLLFWIGVGVLVFHLVTVPPAQYKISVFMFAGGLMGAPYVMNRDEQRTTREPREEKG